MGLTPAAAVESRVLAGPGVKAGGKALRPTWVLGPNDLACRRGSSLWSPSMATCALPVRQLPSAGVLLGDPSAHHTPLAHDESSEESRVQSSLPRSTLI